MTEPHSEENSSGKSPIEQFLTPEAMLTPGVAGSLTMMITNALTLNFAMPRAWVGISLSFIFGLLVLVSTRSMLRKSVFYVLNSLVISCVAAGANGIGTGATQRASLSLITTVFGRILQTLNINRRWNIARFIRCRGSGPKGQSATRQDFGADQAVPNRQQGHLEQPPIQWPK